MKDILCKNTNIGSVKQLRAIYTDDVLRNKMYDDSLLFAYGANWIFDWQDVTVNASYELQPDSAKITVNVDSAYPAHKFLAEVKRKLINQSFSLEFTDENQITQIFHCMTCSSVKKTTEINRTGAVRYELVFENHKDKWAFFNKKPVLQTVRAKLVYYSINVPSSELYVQLFDYCDINLFQYNLYNQAKELIRTSTQPKFTAVTKGIYTVEVINKSNNLITESLTIDTNALSNSTPYLLLSGYNDALKFPKKKLTRNLFDDGIIKNVSATTQLNNNNVLYNLQIELWKESINYNLLFGQTSDINQAKLLQGGTLTPGQYYVFAQHKFYKQDYDYRLINLTNPNQEEITTS